MKFKELGKTGALIPTIGMGTWKLGDGGQGGTLALKEGFRLGAKFVDTAEMYGTEHLVGKALIGEKEVFVATKVSPHHLSYDDVIRSCERSLKELGIRQIDLYQVHWPNKSIPIKETMRAMERLVDEGKIKYIGVSNFDIAEFEEAQAALSANEIVSNQVEYSVLVRDPETSGLLDYCKSNKITLIAYSPLVRGALRDRRYMDFVKILSEIGKEHDATDSQIALSWLLSKEQVVAVPKAGRIEHIRENVASADINLDADEIERIGKVAMRFKHNSVAGPFHNIMKRSSLPWSIHEMLPGNWKKGPH